MAEEFEVEIKGGETPSSETPKETPSETTPKEGETPKEETPVGETPTSELYELPDGRKVDAKTVLDEYKNLQKDYTKKSQELASFKKPEITNDNKDSVLDYKNPEWIPKTYGEIIELAKQEVYKDFQSQKEEEERYETELAQKVDSELSEIKKIDPKIDENKLFEHATKYKMPDLISAYKNMKEMNDRVEAIRQETAKNIQKRASDPVAGQTGQETPIDEMEVYDPRASTTSMIDYLRQIKKK